MTKREQAAAYRKQEVKAIAMYLDGKKLKQIKKRCPMVPSWMVRGLAVAASLNHIAAAAARR